MFGRSSPGGEDASQYGVRALVDGKGTVQMTSLECIGLHKEQQA